MSVELINGHVLLPNQADWKARPKWSRRWENEISDAVTGNESRYALRAQPRVTLQVTKTLKNRPPRIADQQMLDDRIRAAAKLGKACTPFHGRGGVLTANAVAGSDEVTVRSAWLWQAGDYFFAGDENESDALLVTDADLADGIWTLTLDAVLTFTHAAGELAWPLLFGEFSADKMPALTPRFGPVRITIRELVSARTAQIGELVPDAGDGIGSMAIGDDFAVA